MARIIQISDLHFGKTRKELSDSLIKVINHSHVDLVIICGDFTQRAKVSEFRMAQRFLQKLNVPWLAIPGNHDLPNWALWERVFAPYQRYQKFIHRDLSPVFRLNDLIVMGVNSSRPFGWYWDWGRGRVSWNQMEDLKRLLKKETETRLKIVVTHHPFLLTPETLDRKAIGRGHHALKMFSQSGVDLLLGGHLHKAFNGLIGSDEKGRGTMVVAQASTAISTRLKKEPNAFNLLSIKTDSICIENNRWTKSRFEPFTKEVYRKSSGGWKLVQKIL